MASSGTYNYTLDNSSVIVEAFERCGVEPTQLTTSHYLSARRSLNLTLVKWSNRGVNLWEVIGPVTVPLVTGQATYTVPNNCVTLLDMYYTTVNGGGQGVNIDRIMLPISRTEYAQYPNKQQQGIPSTFWYQKLTPTPQFTIYQAPFQGSPNYQLNYYYMSQIQDANVVGSETPNVPYRFMEALCADTAYSLSQKPALCPNADKAFLKLAASEAWTEAMETDREDVPMVLSPNFSGWFQV